MTVFMNEIIGSDDVQATGQFDPISSTSQIILWECPDGAEWTPTYNTAADVHRGLSDFSLVYRAAIGYSFDKYNGSSWDPVTAGTEFGTMLVRSVIVVENTSKPNAWTITIQETGMGGLILTGGAIIGSPAVSVNVTARTRNVDAWRAQPLLTLPTDTLDAANDYYFDPASYPSCDSVVDNIGGTELDVNGQPAKTTIEQNVITIEFIARSPHLQWDETYTTETAYQNALALGNSVGARNAETLMYYPIGSLRVTDVAIQPLHHEFKRVVWTMVADAWNHADQRPWMNKQGVIATIENATCAGGDAPTFHAESVFWRQPHLEAFSMSDTPEAYFPAGGWDLIWAKFGTDSSSYSPAYPSP